ncbi:DNA polymerase [Bradyrhizobium erythrophlei]|uniref:DNA polymerase n=1 Tax=Bradyrhizobium erythrophlei TaxID=1437360 RepID=UPI0018D2CB55|nr:DNA polymerase [Bradyrhizobium erythrophlei]
MSAFREIVLIDFEFQVPVGGQPIPVCCVAHEVRSGRTLRIWQDGFGKHPPFATGAGVLSVAYYSSAEWGCYRALGWPMPERVLDLFVEFRNLTNGLPVRAGYSMIGALTHFGLPIMDAVGKKELQEAIGTGSWSGRFTRQEILDYCESDVIALKRLLPVMEPFIDLPRALLRGRYMCAVSAVEFNGTPIDTDMLTLLRDHWTGIQDRLIESIDRDYGVYDGRTFKMARFARWLVAQGIPWPTLESGQLDLSDETFRQQAKGYPQVSPLRELRNSLAGLRLNDLSVGGDGRNRCLLSAFRARTGRNQPSNSRYIFGPSVWVRGLIKPQPEHAVVYLDYRQQEFGIAAALSGDAAMQQAYRSGDCYLTFAKQANAVPADATKATHGPVRELYKQCVLGVQYAMGEQGLAMKIGQPKIVARGLLEAHRQTYKTFWRWSDAAVDTAVLAGRLQTVFGWQIQVGQDYNPRSLRNFPMQGNGSEMLRLACCLAAERGVQVTALVHDALMIYARIDTLDEQVEITREAMIEASRIVLAGFEVGVDVSITRWPNRYVDPRGQVMWDRVVGLIPSVDQWKLKA